MTFTRETTVPSYEVTLRADVIYTVVLDAEDEDEARKDALWNIDWEDVEIDFDVDTILEIAAAAPAGER